MKRLSLVILLFGLSVAAGCSRPDPASRTDSAASSSPTAGDWIIVRYEAEPDSLNPITATTGVSNYAMLGANNSQIY